MSMSLELLKSLIESACSDGIVTPQERRYLEKKAAESNVSIDDLNFMINSEMEKVKSQNQWISANDADENNGNGQASGFITSEHENQQQQNNTGMASGFVSSADQEKTISSGASKFTDVTTLDNQGAMSLVQKAKYYGKWVIIKRLKPEYENNPNYKNLFYKEFENAYHLDHTNIVRLLDKGKDATGSYFTMEYIDGRRLTKVIHNEKIKDEKFIKKLATEILDALIYVHKKQIYHRDLKPDNILITYKGDNVKILDFGLAAADSFDDNLLKVGTPRYAAPEQMVKGNIVDQRADIYSFGLILAELITGRIFSKDFSDIQNKKLAAIVEKCIQPNVNNRYQNCEEIKKDLEDAPTLTRIIPPRIEAKMQEFAADGIITANERKVLDLELQNNNIDPKVAETYLQLELEKAKDKIKQQKQAAAQNEKKRQELEEKQRARERNLKKKEQQLEAERKALEREAQRKAAEEARRRRSASPQQKTYKPARRKSKSRAGFWLRFFLVLFVIVFILIKKDDIQDEYTERFTKMERKYIIAKTTLNLRSEKSLQSKVIESYPFGTEVKVYSENNGWAKVKINGKKGFMSSEYLAGEEEFIQNHYDKLIKEYDL